MIHIGGKTYELVQEHKNGYNYEAFRDRYSEVLDRYDYIVGDWGYNQLRLKGFFKENHRSGNKDSCVTGLHDYLNEYCNFGCAYFILRKVAGKSPDPATPDQPAEPAAQQAKVHASSAQAPQPQQHQPHHHRHERRERHDRHERSEQRHSRPERHDRPERAGHQERGQPQK